MSYKVISFYQYTKINQPEHPRVNLKTECLKGNLLGRILIAQEGINGAVSGRAEKIELFKTQLVREFPGLTFREQSYPKSAYHKLVVRVRPEICAFNAVVNINKSGTHLSPDQLKILYENQEEFYIIDARND